MLEVNTLVYSVEDPSATGIIRKILPNGQYRVFLNNEMRIMDEKSLLPLPEYSLENEYNDIDAGSYGDSSDLNTLIVQEKMSGKLTNIYYSMHVGNTDFYPHQFKPVLQFIESISNRLIIADEVGLGKTIEALYIWKEMQVRDHARNLVIFCPSMLSEKWKNDMEIRFGLESEIVSADLLTEKVKEQKYKTRKNGFSLICSLESLRIHYNKDKSELVDLLDTNADEFTLFDLVIFDEAHYLRNAATSSFKMAQKVRGCTQAMVLLSATPIQTSSKNLYTLLQLVAPEHFDDEETFHQFLNRNSSILGLVAELQKPVCNRDTIFNACAEVIHVKMVHPVLIEEIRSLFNHTDTPPIQQRTSLAYRLEQQAYLSSYLTRSRKVEVFENRVIRDSKTVTFSLSEIEENLYMRASQHLKAAYGKNGMFAVIVKQRLIASCLPIGIRNLYKNLSEEDQNFFMQEYDNEGQNFGKESIVSLKTESFPDFQTLKGLDSKYKSLVQELRASLKPIAGENKVIIFTGFRMTADYLLQRMQTEEHFAISYIHGGMGKEKYLIINQFKNATEPRILLSTEVGSEGIDLQFCDTIINYDLPWNPMRIEQRIGRIDRIGQSSKRIRIRNIICRNTIEDRILDRLYSRISIFENTIGSLDDILGMEVEKLIVDLSNKQLTDNEIDEQLARNEAVRAISTQLKQELQEKAPRLASAGQYILESIKQSDAQKHYITQEDIFSYVHEYLSRLQSKEYKLEPHVTEPYCYIMTLPTEIKRRLEAFCSKHPELRNTRLWYDAGTPFYIHFQTQGTESRLSTQYKEIIDIEHPLVKYIDSQIQLPSYPKTVCSVIHLDTDVMASVSSLIPGLYTYYIERWSISGSLNIAELRYYLQNHNEPTEISTSDAERIITFAAQKGYSGFEYYGYYNFKTASSCYTALIDRCRSDYNKFRTEYEQRTNIYKDQREAFINLSFDAKLMTYNKLLEQMCAENKPNVARLYQGKIEKLNHQKAQNLAEIKETKIDSFATPIAVGLLCIV
jgi:ERCC4-related helicase